MYKTNWFRKHIYLTTLIALVIGLTTAEIFRHFEEIFKRGHDVDLLVAMGTAIIVWYIVISFVSLVRIVISAITQKKPSGLVNEWIFVISAFTNALVIILMLLINNATYQTGYNSGILSGKQQQETIDNANAITPVPPCYFPYQTKFPCTAYTTPYF